MGPIQEQKTRHTSYNIKYTNSGGAENEKHATIS